jgi:hypothetical protein
MCEPFRNDLDRDALVCQEGCVGVFQIAEPNARNSGSFHETRDGGTEAPWDEWLRVRASKYEALIVISSA